MKIRILVFAAVLVCAFAQLNAANYYMSPGGSDSDTGASPTHAWASLQHGRDILVAGDTLFVMGGTYSTAQIWNGGNGGNALHPIVIKAYGDAVATFTVGGAVESNVYFFNWYASDEHGHFVVDGESHLHPGTTRCLVFTGACYRMYQVEPDIGHHRNGMVLRGCEFDGRASNASGMGAYPVALAYADSFVIDNCYIHHAWHPTGPTSRGGDNSDNAQSVGECLFIRSCEFGNITNNTFTYGDHGLVNIQAVRTSGAHSSRFIHVSGNLFDNGWGGGLYLTFNSTYCLVENNIFAHSGVTTDYPKPGLQLGGSYNTVRKNVFYCPANQAMTINSQDELDGFYSVCNRNYIYNNTFYNSGAYSIQMYVDNDNGNRADCSAERNTIVNNIFYKTDHLIWTEGVERFKALLRLELYHANDAHNWVDPDVYGNYPNTTAWGHNKFWNNLFRYDSRGLAPDTMVLYTSDMHNLHGSFYTYNIATLQADGSGAWANSIGSDPMLYSENPDVYGISRGWWHLQPGSQCIDAGVAVVDSNGIYVETNYPGYGWGNLRYEGSAPDIGAYEVNGENPTPPMAPVLSSSPTRKR